MNFGNSAPGPQDVKFLTYISFLLIRQASKSVCQLCCAPCIWLRASSTVHKMAITTATLLVTSLLVASPILFLISAAPSQIQRDCYAKDDDDCMPTQTPPPECAHTICKETANSIQARMNWKEEPCDDFKAYSCSPIESGLHFMRSAQESADLEMQREFRKGYLREVSDVHSQ
jgi:hypothetical protein